MKKNHKSDIFTAVEKAVEHPELMPKHVPKSKSRMRRELLDQIEYLAGEIISLKRKLNSHPRNHQKDTRVQLDFMVVPELLASKAYVPDAVRCAVVDPEAIFLTGILGESGRRLVKAGIEFYFTKRLADKLIGSGIAVKVNE